MRLATRLFYFTTTCLGEGERAGVELVSVEGGTSDSYPGESSDVSAQALLRFDQTNPFTYSRRTIRVRNSTNVELPYIWRVVSLKKRV